MGDFYGLVAEFVLLDLYFWFVGDNILLDLNLSLQAVVLFYFV